MPKLLYSIAIPVIICSAVIAAISFYKTSQSLSKTNELLSSAQRITIRSDSIISRQNQLIETLKVQTDSLTRVASRLETDNKTIIKNIDTRLLSVNRDIDKMVMVLRKIEIDTIR